MDSLHYKEIFRKELLNNVVPFWTKNSEDKEYGGFSSNEIKQLAIGNVVAFVVALLAIKFFIGFLKKHGFKVWGYYRIVVGILLLILIYTGYLKS